MRSCLFLAAALLSSSALAQQSQRADLCAELSAYVQAQNKASAAAESAPSKEQATAVQAPSKTEQRPQPGGQDAPQQTSGLSGPVTHGGTGASGPQGQAQESAPSGQQNPQAGGRSEQAANRPPLQPGQPQGQQQQQSQANPPAAAQPPQAPPPSQDQIAAAQSAIDGKDVLACRDAAQKMRRAGVSLPAPLLALAAVDPKILKPDADAGGR